MKTTLKRYITLSSAFLLLYYGCFWKSDCGNGKDEIAYTFYLPYTFSPAKDTFKINDTIHIHADFEDQLFDSTNLKYYKAENVVFESAFTLSRADTIGLPRAFSSFSIIADTGSLLPSGGIIYIKYSYGSNYYRFNAKLIPKRKGIFVFSLDALTFQEVDLQKDCRIEYMNLFFTTNGDAENNFHLLAESPEPFWQNFTQQEFKRHGYYVFRVVE